MATPISGISNEIARQLKRYNLILKEDIEAAEKEFTKEAVEELKNSPLTPRLTGDYAEGWTQSKVKGHWVAHNETDYQLTHLLEKGHAKVGGGRVNAYPHIEQIADKAAEKFEERIDDIVRLRG